jgi:peptidoglycan/LPS O-acetylase OafA/YrhL
MAKSPQLGFHPRLESLRGLAALGVVATHCFGAFRVDGLKAYYFMPFSEQPMNARVLTVLGSLLNPDGSIVVFFILSGYVLSLSFLRSEESLGRQLGPYLVRRLLRLLPAMWLSILFMAIVRQLPSDAIPISLQTNFFYGAFHRSIDLSAIWRNCVLIDFRVNPVTWTMYVEVIGSIFIPLMIALTRRGRSMGFGFLLILILVAGWTHSGIYDARNYLFCFQTGVFLACHPDLIRKIRVARWPTALFVCGCGLMFIQRMASINNLRGTLLLAVGATMVLAAVLGAPSAATFRWLDRRPIRLLGRVSYSFYLLHLAVMYVLAQAFVSLGVVPKLGGVLPALLLMACTVGFTAPLAWLSYTAIELPFIRLGKTSRSERGGKPPQRDALSV